MCGRRPPRLVVRPRRLPHCSYPDFVICTAGIVVFVGASFISSPPFLYRLREMKVAAMTPSSILDLITNCA
jgi:hypothetical protein